MALYRLGDANQQPTFITIPIEEIATSTRPSFEILASNSVDPSPINPTNRNRPGKKGIFYEGLGTAPVEWQTMITDINNDYALLTDPEYPAWSTFTDPSKWSTNFHWFLPCADNSTIIDVPCLFPSIDSRAYYLERDDLIDLISKFPSTTVSFTANNLLVRQNVGISIETTVTQLKFYD